VQHTVYLFDGFQLDVTRRKLISSGGLVQPLSSRAMEALLLLVANAGELVEKRRLMQTVWPNAIVEDNNLNQCVLAIRKALGETAGSNRYIMTVPGRGYRFVTPVRAVVQESAPEAVVSVTAARHPQRWSMWLGGTAVLFIIALTILLLRIEAGARHQEIAVMPPGASSDPGTPEIVLRLHDRRDAAGNPSVAPSTDVILKCLAMRPTMKLRVRVELLSESGAPVWSDTYVVGAEDLVAQQASGASTATNCQELIAALARD
jgi:DNA-binding winged helix-turn-helix (wHTH) protein